MLQENRAIADSQGWEAELDHKLTLPDLTVSVMSEVWALFTTQRDTQLNTVTVSKVHDMSILPKLSLKVVLYSVRARTGEHETSQENKYLSGHLSFLMVFFFSQREKKVLDNTISFSVQKKVQSWIGIAKVTFFFARIYCCCLCLSFVLSQCWKNNIIKLASWKLNCIFLSEM